MQNQKTITVTGKGLLKIHPDATRVIIELTGIKRDYGEAILLSSESTKNLQNLLQPLGFNPTEIKTVSFSVEPERERYKEYDGYETRLVGYRFNHSLKIEFDSDNRRLSDILFALGHSSMHPEFSLAYTVKNPEAVKNRLLAKAVEDAKIKAEVLAKAAGIHIGELVHIDYSWGKVDFEVRPVQDVCFESCGMAPAGGISMDIEPDDMEAEDTVTVVWEIINEK